MKRVNLKVTNYGQVEVKSLDFLELSSGHSILLDTNLDLQNGCFLKGSRNSATLFEEFKESEKKMILTPKPNQDILDFLIESFWCRILYR